MTTGTMSLDEAVRSLHEFLLENVPEGTAVEVTEKTAEEMSRMASNLVAMATNQGVNVVQKRQAYEAVGWLSVQIESWFYDSPYDDMLLEKWAHTML